MTNAKPKLYILSERYLNKAATQPEITLLCPHCESEYLHEILTHIVERDNEDGDATTITCSNSDGIKIERKGQRRIKLTRRSYLLIYFYCEECPHLSVLAIKQHKGTTLMQWLDEEQAYDELPTESADWLHGFMSGHATEMDESSFDSPVPLDEDPTPAF